MKRKQLLTKTFLIAAMLFVGMSAWADNNPITVYEKGTTGHAWTADDVSTFTVSGATLSYSATAGMTFDHQDANSSFYATKTFSHTAKSLLTVDAFWNGYSNTSAGYSQGAYFSFGNIYVYQNDQDQKSGYGFGGMGTTAAGTFSHGTYRASTSPNYHIQFTIDTSTNKLLSFTVKSEDDATTWVNVANVVLDTYDYTTLKFGFNKTTRTQNEKTSSLISIKITETPQEVEDVNFTVKFRDTDGNILKDDVVHDNGVVGEVYYATASDMATFYNGENTKKYVYKSGQNTATVASSNASENVITLVFDTFEKYTYSLKYKLGNADAVEQASATLYEDETATIYYPICRQDDSGNYYVTSKNTSAPYFGAVVSYTNQNVTVNYTQDENIVYYAESENMTGSRYNYAQAASYASNGASYCSSAGETSYIATNCNFASDGYYDIEVGMANRNYSVNTTPKLMTSKDDANPVTLEAISLSSNNYTQKPYNNQLIAAGQNLYIFNDNGNSASKWALDYVILRKVAPSITTQPIGATYDVNAEATALSVVATAAYGGELSYQWYSNTSNSTEGATSIDGATESSYTPSTATSGTTTYYFCQVTEEDNSIVATSDVVSVVINAETVSTPTFTIGSYDYEQGGYVITPACTTEGATLTYTIGGGAATECTNGVPFYAVNGALVVTASKTNWVSSSSESVTLNSAPAATSPESLIPFSSSTDNYDKNLMHTYKSVSIPGDNFAGINGGTGLKLRTGKMTSIDNVTGLQLNVIEGYKVTKVAFSNAYSNNSTAISVNSVYVDGTQLSNFEAKTLPATGSTTAFDIDGISATQSIVIGMGTEANQYRATITVTYEKNSVDATIGTYGYATFSSTYALDFTNVDNATAFIVSRKNNDGSAIVMQPVTGKIAAGTGLILKGTKGSVTNVTIPITSETGTYYNTTSDIKNYLFPINTDEYELKAATDGTNYILTVQSEKVVFAPIANISATMNKGQAALWLPTSDPARALTLSFGEEEITAIDGISSNEPKASKNYYNLQGQRVSQPKQGIYVVEGKKVLVK